MPRKRKRDALDRELPRACNIFMGRCGDPECESVHLILMNSKGTPFADAPLHISDIDNFVNALQEHAAALQIEVEEARACVRLN